MWLIPGVLRVEPARPGDLDAIVAVLQAARDAQVERGQPPAWSWVRRERVEWGIADGVVFVGRDADGSVVATIELREEDPEIWGDDPTPALYVHRLAVEPAKRSQGLGRAMIRFAAEQATERGKTFVRLDVLSDGVEARAWYERQGFVALDEVRPPSYTRPSTRYEKRAT